MTTKLCVYNGEDPIFKCKRVYTLRSLNLKGCDKLVVCYYETIKWNILSLCITVHAILLNKMSFKSLPRRLKS